MIRTIAPRAPLAGALKEAGLLLAAALLLTAALWAVRSPRLPLRADPVVYRLELAAPLVPVARAVELFDAGDHLFVDTRPDNAQRLQTVPGSLRVRAASLENDLYELFDLVYPEDPIILYGDGDLTGTATVATLLTDKGYSDLQILAGGIAAWQRAGGPVDAVEAP